MATLSKITFVPVVINRGRKFRGKAFYLGYDSQCAVAWNVTAWSTKLWDSNNKRYVYANPDFCEDDKSLTEADIAKARDEYILNIINSTITWCASKDPSKSDIEIKRFARNVLRKSHPELIDDINVLLPDSRDVVPLVENAVKWAINLRTKPCVIYGKACKGGKKYPKSKIRDIAYKCCVRNGATQLEGFEEAWQFFINMYELT